MVEITTAIGAAAASIFLFCGDVILDEINDSIYDSLTEHKINRHDHMNGIIQKMPIHRNADGDEIVTCDGHELSTSYWKEVPHILSICHYALHRAGIFSFYWTRSLALLNLHYVNWIHTIPAESPLHQSGNYAETFVEMHLKYFQNGLRGRVNSTF
jgi:hypothetical protein